MAKYNTRKELLDALNATPSLSGFLRNTTYDDFAQNDDLGPLPELWVGIRKLVMSGDLDSWTRGLGLYAQTIAALRGEASEERPEHALDLDGNCPVCDAEDETLVETAPEGDNPPACNCNVGIEDCPGCQWYRKNMEAEAPVTVVHEWDFATNTCSCEGDGDEELTPIPTGVPAFAGILK